MRGLMSSAVSLKSQRRYQVVAEEKAGGATYTPSALADFVASRMLEAAKALPDRLRILDPAIGDGELLLSLLTKLSERTTAAIDVYGFDTDALALVQARQRLKTLFPRAQLHFEHGSFLDFVLDLPTSNKAPSLFEVSTVPQHFDLIIANPPYVRTQIMGASQAQNLGEAFGLSGRVDLYHAFLIAISQVLGPEGVTGIIVSNRFMTTKGGATLRAALRDKFSLRSIWDLGDSKLFGAAVLPAVIVAGGCVDPGAETPLFVSMYETDEAASAEASAPIEALSMSGVVGIKDGRRFHIKRGTLDAGASRDDLWRIATAQSDKWLATVEKHTGCKFRDIGKVRVGVKTCADRVFIRSDWQLFPEAERPELLRPLITHHSAGRFRPIVPKKIRSILYPHEVVGGQRRAADLTRNPKSRAYLEGHRKALEARTYVIENGRRWYELWVPQDPGAWLAPKLVFRDISERPTFWLDFEGSIVNGDCYWLTAERSDNDERLWLAAAVANSTFVEAFYDHRFNNKLYAGRRRFITQYVEQFPLPNPATTLSREIVNIAKLIYEGSASSDTLSLQAQLDVMVWQAFGLSVEEVRR